MPKLVKTHLSTDRKLLGDKGLIWITFANYTDCREACLRLLPQTTSAMRQPATLPACHITFTPYDTTERFDTVVR